MLAVSASSLSSSTSLPCWRLSIRFSNAIAKGMKEMSQLQYFATAGDQ